MIKITGDKGKIDITFDDKIVRFYGDLCTRYFAAIANTMTFIEPQNDTKPTKEEIAEIIKELGIQNIKDILFLFTKMEKEYLA